MKAWFHISQEKKRLKKRRKRKRKRSCRLGYKISRSIWKERIFVCARRRRERTMERIREIFKRGDEGEDMKQAKQMSKERVTKEECLKHPSGRHGALLSCRRIQRQPPFRVAVVQNEIRLRKKPNDCQIISSSSHQAERGGTHFASAQPKFSLCSHIRYQTPPSVYHSSLDHVPLLRLPQRDA